MPLTAYMGASPTNIKVGDFKVGKIIQIKENGVPIDYIIIHQGNPSTSLYDSSCDGTWVLRKDIYINSEWDSSQSTYNNSTIHQYLNNTFFACFDEVVRAHIKTIKIPYASVLADVDATGKVLIGSNGMSTQVFLLSGCEVGWENVYVDLPKQEGIKLDYFLIKNTEEAKKRRLGYYGGTVAAWMLRSLELDQNNPGRFFYVNDTGTANSVGMSNKRGIRPAFILDKNTWWSDGILVNEPLYEIKNKKIKDIYIGENAVIKSFTGLNDNTLKDSNSWEGYGNYNINKVEDYYQITPIYIADAGKMYHCKRYYDTPIIGRDSSTRKLILITAMVRGYSTNVGYPWVGLYYDVKDSTGTKESFYRIATDLETGVQYTGLNDGQWHKVGMLRETCATNGNGSLYYDYTGFAIGIASPDDNTKVSTSDKFDIKDLCVFDLTEVYGQGNEPSLAWCTANITGQGEKVILSNLPNKARRIKKVYMGDNFNKPKLIYAKATPEDLIDFDYIDNGDNTYTITNWKGTYQGNSNTKIIIPEGSNIIW